MGPQSRHFSPGLRSGEVVGEPPFLGEGRETIPKAGLPGWRAGPEVETARQELGAWETEPSGWRRRLLQTDPESEF